MSTWRISAWGIRNPIPVAILFISLTIAGLISYGKLPIKQNPDVTFPIVSVSVTQNGAAPVQMETQITRPVENAIAGIANVKHISSSVTLGASVTTIEFELGTDMQKATDEVRTAVERERVSLPAGIDPPTVQRLDIDSAPILTYAVSSTRLSPTALSWFVDDTVARALQAQRGVAQVVRVGGVDREINVTLDPARMRAFGVTAPQVNLALAQFNTDETGGRAEVGGREQTVRVLGQATTVAALRDLVVPVPGRYVRLSDVAEVGDGSAEPRAFARLDGRPAVAFQVNKTRASSEVTVEQEVVAAIATLGKAHPEVTFTLVVTTVEQTRESFTATVHVLLEGMALAALVVFLFLKSWRATAIAAAAMPLSLIPTFTVMRLLGFSLNQLTMLSLTLVIGILVDDAIVEIENIEKRIERGQSPYRAALIGADSIGLAVIATTSAIVVVFTPVSFMGGIPGEFFKQFGLTVAISVLFSLLTARLVTPLMAAYLLKPRPHAPERPLGGLYRRSLDWALGHRWAAAGVGALVFFASVALMTRLPVGFQPVNNAGIFYLNVEGPPGASRAEMERIVADATRLLKREPDVARVFAQIGGASGGGFDAPGGGDLRAGTITVVLKHDRSLTTDLFKRHLRPLLRTIPDVRINTQGGFGSADVDTILSGEDGATLERAQLELEREMRGVKLISDIRPSPPPAGPELVVRPKPDEAARLGVTSQALAQVLRIATIGDIDANVAKFSEGERRIPIRVRLPEPARTDLTVLGELQAPTLNGGSTPLSSVADLSFEAGPGKIVRYNRHRRVSVQADLANGASLGNALAAVNALPIMRHLPRGVTTAPIGDAEVLGEVISGFIGAIFAGVALIFGVLVLLFRSFFKPAIIMGALPLSIAGAVVALLIAGKELDMPVFIGVLMLFGIAAKNSILLVEFAIEDERAGQSRLQALHNACRERARPIVMTTVAMIAGMGPTALGFGQGSEFRQPMAIAVIGGLISSTVLSLVLIPVIYLFVDEIEQWMVPKLGRLITRKRPGDDAPIVDGEETLVTPPRAGDDRLAVAAE